MDDRGRDRVQRGGEFCSAISCTNARNKKSCAGISFFRFPKDEERCRRWVQNMRRQDLQNIPPAILYWRKYILCSEHFEGNQFLHPADRDRLVWNAVPTVFSVPNPPPKTSSTRRKLDGPAAPDKPTPKRTLSTQTDANIRMQAEGIEKHSSPDSTDMTHHTAMHKTAQHSSSIASSQAKEGRPLECKFCGMEFRCLESLEQHLVVHLNNKPYKCECCQASFATRSSLKVHMLTKHVDGKLFTCDLCSASYTQKGRLNRHKRMKHFSGNEYVCPVCNAVFINASTLHAHVGLYRHHSEGMPDASSSSKLLCKDCGKTFNSLKNLEKHMLVHRSNKPYVCSVCHAAFSVVNSLRKHYRTRHEDTNTQMPEDPSIDSGSEMPFGLSQVTVELDVAEEASCMMEHDCGVEDTNNSQTLLTDAEQCDAQTAEEYPEHTAVQDSGPESHGEAAGTVFNGHGIAPNFCENLYRNGLKTHEINSFDVTRIKKEPGTDSDSSYVSDARAVHQATVTVVDSKSERMIKTQRDADPLSDTTVLETRVKKEGCLASETELHGLETVSLLDGGTFWIKTETISHADIGNDLSSSPHFEGPSHSAAVEWGVFTNLNAEHNTENTSLRLNRTLNHFPIVADAPDKKCVVCSERLKRAKKRRHNKRVLQTKSIETSFQCSSCHACLCIKKFRLADGSEKQSDCWLRYHTVVEFWHPVS